MDRFVVLPLERATALVDLQQEPRIRRVSGADLVPRHASRLPSRVQRNNFLVRRSESRSEAVPPREGPMDEEGWIPASDPEARRRDGAGVTSPRASCRLWYRGTARDA